MCIIHAKAYVMGIGFLVSLRLNKYTVTIYYYFSFFLFFFFFVLC